MPLHRYPSKKFHFTCTCTLAIVLSRAFNEPQASALSWPDGIDYVEAGVPLRWFIKGALINPNGSGGRAPRALPFDTECHGAGVSDWFYAFLESSWTIYGNILPVDRLPRHSRLPRPASSRSNSGIPNRRVGQTEPSAQKSCLGVHLTNCSNQCREHWMEYLWFLIKVQKWRTSVTPGDSTEKKSFGKWKQDFEEWHVSRWSENCFSGREICCNLIFRYSIRGGEFDLKYCWVLIPQRIWIFIEELKGWGSL